MAQVDPEDDTIERFVVYHYRYDPGRRERRHVLVAVFDNEREFQARVDREQAELERRRRAGEPTPTSACPGPCTSQGTCAERQSVAWYAE